MELDDGVLVVGYGSLMSGKGLERSGLRSYVQSASIVEICGKRGFGKPTQKGGIAMDMDCFGLIERQSQSDHSFEIEPQEVLSFQALAIKFPRAVLPCLAKREGYSIKRMEKILAKHHDQGPAEYLWELFWETSRENAYNLWEEFQEILANNSVTEYSPQMRKLYDTIYRDKIKKYREKLRNDCILSKHYNPHPVRLRNGSFAITFIAAGRLHPETEPAYKDEKAPEQEREVLSLVKVSEALDVYPDLDDSEFKEKMREYCLECLLAELQGVMTYDIIDFIDNEDIRLRIIDSLEDMLSTETEFLRQTSKLVGDRQISSTDLVMKKILNLLKSNTSS